ncbi:MAG: hypothetical protein WAX77_15635 [Methylococcaceae bacterium]
MKTYFFGKEEIDCYCSDLAERLIKLDGDYPTLWCLIGFSGEKIARVVIDFIREKGGSTPNVVIASYDRNNKNVIFTDGYEENCFKTEKPILIIDSSIHSGKSMLNVAKKLNAEGANHLISYSLVLKRSADFIPTYFGVIIDDYDRAFFQLDKIPNNRMLKNKPFGIVRTLVPEDAHRNPPYVEMDMADKALEIHFGDFIYEKETIDSKVYVFELDGKIEAILSFRYKSNGSLFIDFIATSNNKNIRGQKVGGMLMRWAESCARSSNCCCIELYAIEERVSFYENCEYKRIGKTLDCGTAGTFVLMRRELLYNIKKLNIE